MKIFFMLMGLFFALMCFVVLLALVLGVAHPWHSVTLAGSVALAWLCACEIERLESES